jgi:hypothetical protein
VPEVLEIRRQGGAEDPQLLVVQLDHVHARSLRPPQDPGAAAAAQTGRGVLRPANTVSSAAYTFRTGR